MKIIHLSDTHFVPPGKKLYGREPRVALDAAIADINANHADAELVIATGDLTHWGEPSAFESLAESFAALDLPLKLLIGNHDARNVFRSYFPDQDGDGTGFIHSVQDTSAGRFVYLDTVLAGTHEGHFCADRCQWLSETLSASAGRDVFLFMHHPPFLIGLPALDAISLQQRDEFRAAVEPHKASIRHLFFGHVHRTIAGSWLGIPVSSVRSMNHQTRLQMTEGPLAGNFEPPSYAVVLIENDQVVVHFHDFMDDSHRFFLAESPWDDWSRRKAHP